MPNTTLDKATDFVFLLLARQSSNKVQTLFYSPKLSTYGITKSQFFIPFKSIDICILIVNPQLMPHAERPNKRVPI